MTSAASRSHLCGLVASGQAPRERRATYPELPVDPRKVQLDRADAHEELGRDLLVRTAPRGQPGDPSLRLGELLLDGRLAAADPAKPAADLLDPQRRAEPSKVASASTSVSRGACFCSRLPRADAEREQRSAALKRIGSAIELGEGAIEASNAAARSPSAAASRPAAARGAGDSQGLPSRCARSSYGPRYARACSSSPRATSVSSASGQRGTVGSVPPRGDEALPGSLRRRPAAASEVAERELEAASMPRRMDRLELVSGRPRTRAPARPESRACSTRPRSASTRALTHPAHPRSAANWVCSVSSYAAVARPCASCQEAGEPLEQAEGPEDQHAENEFVTACDRSVSSLSSAARGRSSSP